MSGKAKWTILTYIAAHNNLARFGRRSLLDILAVGSTPEVVHGALFDEPGGAGRYVMGSPGKVLEQAQLRAFDSGDPDGLITTARWLFEQRPAERYGLVLWSHGSGWEPSEIETIAREARPGAALDANESNERSVAPGARVLFRTTLRQILKPDKPAERAILFDDGTGHSLDTLELAQVTGTIADAVGQPLDLLGMDACLMGNLEVAYEVRKGVRYLVASEELVPGHSWPYQEIFGVLRTTPELDGAALTSLVVDRYVNFYTANPPGAGDVTKVALDLGRIAELTGAAGLLAEALRASMSAVGDALWQVQREAEQRETNAEPKKRESTKFDSHLWDLGSLTAGLVESRMVSPPVKDRAAAMLRALAPGAGAVLAEGHRGAWFDATRGVSIYLVPPRKQRVSAAYSRLAFARDTHWDEMLGAYHAAVS
jgi:hypothetical protein